VFEIGFLDLIPRLEKVVREVLHAVKVAHMVPRRE